MTILKFWRDRAESARVSAGQTKDRRCREMLKQLAKIYQELAEQAKRQAKQTQNIARRDREREWRRRVRKEPRRLTEAAAETESPAVKRHEEAKWT